MAPFFTEIFNPAGIHLGDLVWSRDLTCFAVATLHSHLVARVIHFLPPHTGLVCVMGMSEATLLSLRTACFLSPTLSLWFFMMCLGSLFADFAWWAHLSVHTGLFLERNNILLHYIFHFSFASFVVDSVLGILIIYMWFFILHQIFHILPYCFNFFHICFLCYWLHSESGFVSAIAFLVSLPSFHFQCIFLFTSSCWFSLLVTFCSSAFQDILSCALPGK